MRKQEVLTLQIGNNSNYVGSHLWNSRQSQLDDSENKTIAIDLNENIEPVRLYNNNYNNNNNNKLLWDGPVQTSYRNDDTVTQDIVNDMELMRSGTRYWSSMLRAELHPSKGIYSLPTWTTSNNFTSFHNGYSRSAINDTVNSSCIESILDSCRYFAEACDYFSAIEIFCDGSGGCSGLSTSLLEELREDYGSSVALPVWSIQDNIISSSQANGDKGEQLDYALLYGLGQDNYNSLIPVSLSIIRDVIYDNNGIIDTPPFHSNQRNIYDQYITAAVAAAAIDITTSYYEILSSVIRGNSDAEDESNDYSSNKEAMDCKFFNTHEWCSSITMRGRTPICFLEATLPGITHPLPPLVGNTGNRDLFIQDCILHCFSDSSTVIGNASVMNPFTVSLSPTVIGKNNNEAQTFTKGFSNIVSSRGPLLEDVVSVLYAQCFKHPYHITACVPSSTPIYCSANSPLRTFPNLFPMTADGRSGINVAKRTGVSAVGASSDVGKYISEIGSIWTQHTIPHSLRQGGMEASAADKYNGSSAAMHQCSQHYDEAGMETTDRIELSEQLQELGQRYVLN